ncbi:MAG: ATPase, T2SS/T4P/T4SS family [Chloroflexota bacterium]|nr:ATPase, T2SS/T4P/T4SS family [Chloroflexota bacterium]
MSVSSRSEDGLRQILVESGLVSTEQLSGLTSGKERPRLGQLLLERGVITTQQLAIALGRQLNIPYIDLNTCQIQPEALRLIPAPVARKYNAIPLVIKDSSLQVAMAEPDDVLALEALAARAQLKIKPAVAAVDEIREAIDRNYQAYGEIEKEFSRIPAPAPSAEDRVSTEAITGAPAVRAVSLIVEEAVKTRASDIHIEPGEDRLRVRYRIDGVLHETMSLPLTAHAPLISRLKIMANMNIADHHPQDGQFSVKVRKREIDVRVATIHTTYGEMAVLRILNKSFAALNLAEVGFAPDNLEEYERMLKSPYGMILSSGPTGSGKTTTLYASVNHLDRRGRNIITVEDPVEYRFKDINQIQVNPRAGLTFATGLRAIMRHDPDIILVGEIRDAETAGIAVQSALTGHLVLSSVHANDSVGALFRLLDLGVEPFLVSSALIGVVAQRLVRRVCPHCQYLSSVPVEEQLAYSRELGEERTEFVYGSGCNSCSNTGYLGRTAVFEILRVSDEIRSMLVTGAGATQIRAQAQKEGMVTMWRDSMFKVKEGITTPSEVMRNIFPTG